MHVGKWIGWKEGQEALGTHWNAWQSGKCSNRKKWLHQDWPNLDPKMPHWHLSLEPKTMGHPGDQISNALNLTSRLVSSKCHANKWQANLAKIDRGRTIPWQPGETRWWWAPCFADEDDNEDGKVLGDSVMVEKLWWLELIGTKKNGRGLTSFAHCLTRKKRYVVWSSMAGDVRICSHDSQQVIS